MPAKKKIKKIWDFFIIIISVTDGDTVEAFIDRGGKEWCVGYVRFALINSEEMWLSDSSGKKVPNPAGVAAKEHLENILEGYIGTGDIKNDKRMYMISQKYKDDNARYISMLYFDINDRDDPYYTINEKVASAGKSVNAAMVRDGYAKFQNYG